MRLRKLLKPRCSVHGLVAEDQLLAIMSLIRKIPVGQRVISLSLSTCNVRKLPSDLPMRLTAADLFLWVPDYQKLTVQPEVDPPFLRHRLDLRDFIGMVDAI